MIHSIRLKNFKGHGDTKIDLGRLTALVGPNSSGKSSILQAIRYMNQIVSNKKSVDHNPTLCRKQEGVFTLIVEGERPFRFRSEENEEDLWNLIVSFRRNQLTRFVSFGEYKADSEPYPPKTLANSKRYELETLTDESLDYIIDALWSIYLKIVAENLASPSYTDHIPPIIEQNGTGLASAVAYLMTYEPDRFQELQNTVRKVIPSLIRIRVRPARIQLREKRLFTMDDTRIPINEAREVTGHELVFDMKGGDAIPAELMSEGTLHTLGLLTALFSPDAPHMVLLDDVEQGLHPKAQRELIQVFRELLESHEDLQIVLTTHSPYVVDELDASQVWVLCQNQFGTIVSCRFSDHPDAERALQVLTTGEFLSAEGESWVLEKERK